MFNTVVYSIAGVRFYVLTQSIFQYFRHTIRTTTEWWWLALIVTNFLKSWYKEDDEEDDEAASSCSMIQNVYVNKQSVNKHKTLQGINMNFTLIFLL